MRLFNRIVRSTAVSLAAASMARAAETQHDIAQGPFKPTWESLAANYHCPDWFRDAKFGIWAHWTAQCVPEQGDWYARDMYIQGSRQYDYQLKHYGHPSVSGFMEMDNLWHAEHWEPEKLMALYKAAGAKYFFALANHHDNFDNYDSTYHAWNSTRVGPKTDIVGRWEKAARAEGLRFGVSVHAAHAWHWFQVAYGYDPVGPLAGVRYDAFRLTKADGKGKWWEGLDPQDLYTGPSLVPPDGITSIRAMNSWHGKTDGVWHEEPPASNPAFTENWYLRTKDLVDKYHPDQLYFDDTGLPLGQAGLDITAHYYNSSVARDGQVSVVVNGKKLPVEHRPALVEDYERGVSDAILPAPWQTDTCIGSWHYDRSIFEKHHYKTVAQVTRMLCDIVSKNGNLMLSVPIKGDGTLDSDELTFLHDMAGWMNANGEGIFGSRPWHVSGEGPAKKVAGGGFNEGKLSYGAEDIRFTTKEGNLYVYVLGTPSQPVTVRSLATGAPFAKPINGVTQLGSSEKISWQQTGDGLVVQKPQNLTGDGVIGFKVVFK